MNKAWETDASGNDLLVLLALCDFSNDEGLSYPSLKTLADKVKISKTTLSYILRAYDEIGVITREKRQRDNKSHTSTMYKINYLNLNFDIKSYKKAYQKARKYIKSSQCEHGVKNHNVNTQNANCEHLYEPPNTNHQFNLSLARADFKTFKKSLIQTYPAFQFSLPGKLGYSESHQGFCLKDGYIFDLHINKLLDKDDSFTIWSYLFKKRGEVFKAAQSQILKEVQ